MKLLIYSLNYAPELTGIGKYNGELAPVLVSSKVDTHVLTAPPYYPEWERHDSYKNSYSTSQTSGVTLYRCPLYVPKQVTTFKRLLHLLSFALSSGVRLLSLIRLKPDAVFIVQPTFFCTPVMLFYCKVTGAKSIMHIQDFEVDAMFGLSKKESGVFKSIVCSVESWVLKRFDVVSSISYSMLERARLKGVAEEKLLFFPNWADTDFVTPLVSGQNVRRDWGYSENDKIILYSGNIGQKQGLEMVLAAAEHFNNTPNVKFVIVGSGSYRTVLEDMARNQKLLNLTFMPLQPWELVPQILAMADVHLVVQKRGAADAVLPSKLTNILSAGGHALVTADAATELGRIAQQYPGIYTCIEPENTAAFIAGLNTVVSYDTKKENTVARQYALDNLNKGNVISRFVESLNSIVQMTKI